MPPGAGRRRFAGVRFPFSKKIAQCWHHQNEQNENSLTRGKQIGKVVLGSFSGAFLLTSGCTIN
jgi:hypothetical protein